MRGDQEDDLVFHVRPQAVLEDFAEQRKISQDRNASIIV
jgi:hypothetical protein